MPIDWGRETYSQLRTGLLDDDAWRRIPVSVRESWTDWRSAPAREGLLLVASCGQTLAGFALCESTTHGMMLRSLHVDDVDLVLRICRDAGISGD